MTAFHFIAATGIISAGIVAASLMLHALFMVATGRWMPPK